MKEIPKIDFFHTIKALFFLTSNQHLRNILNEEGFSFSLNFNNNNSNNSNVKIHFSFFDIFFRLKMQQYGENLLIEKGNGRRKNKRKYHFTVVNETNRQG